MKRTTVRRSAYGGIVALAAVGGASIAIILGPREEHRPAETLQVTKTVTRITTVIQQSPEQAVYVPQTGGAPLYKPDTIYIGVSAGAIHIVKWLSYGGNVARANASMSVSDCVPDCASGHATESRFVMVLRDRVPCKGVPAYGRLYVMQTGGGYGDSTDLAALCDEG